MYVDIKRICDGYDKVRFNYLMSDMYNQLYNETNDFKYFTKSNYIKDCYKYFDIDYYRESQIKDIKHVYLCHDKFCKNCQNVISKARYNKYKPIIDSYSDTYDIYHMVLTVPNVSSLMLRSTLDKMYNKFSLFIKLLSRIGNKRYKYLPFIGYAGCVRALELSYNVNTNDYHPHFHCILLLRKSLDVEQKYINQYSYSNGILNRKFTYIEIMIQKLWYMLYNDIRVTESNFDISDVYSCTCDLTYNYKEVFKYTLKDSFDVIMKDYNTFKLFEDVLYNRRVIQSYGCLYNVKEDINLFAVDDEYLSFINYLLSFEHPESYLYNIDDLFYDIDNSDIKFITRKFFKGSILNDEE